MLTIVHGDDQAASRKFFLDLKGKYPDASITDGSTTTLTDLMQTLEGGGLFNEQKVLCIENLLTKKKTSGDYKAIIEYLQKQQGLAQIFLWEGKELELATLNKFKGSTIRVFKLPQSLFSFLDTIKPGNNKHMLQLFHQTLATMEEEAIFYMLIRHIRMLLSLQPQSPHPTPLPKDEGVSSKGNQIEEVKRMRDWQKGKLIQQSKIWNKEKLIAVYQELFAIEVAYKTGALPSSLSSSIDILLLSI